jgi:3-oxoacyl-[acyl-carrier-protein] synthase-1
LIYAAEMIKVGRIEHALVVGVEFSNRMSALGFSSLGLISTQGMRPFDSERDGLYLGEGCGAVVLSNQPTLNGFGLEGAAYLGDNYNVSTCNPDGSTIAQVINNALVSAGVTTDQIALVKTHGTASLSNDEAEAAGLNLVFEKCSPPAIVFKPYIGHTLGACGIIELILFYQSLIKKNRLPSVPESIIPDSKFNMTFYRNDKEVESSYYLLNYFGFGGNNCSLVISDLESKK